MDSQENTLSTADNQAVNSEEQKEKSSNICPKCGAVLSEGQNFCPICGAKTDSSIVYDTVEVKNKSKLSAIKTKIKEKKVLVIICSIVLIAVVIGLIVALGRKSGSNEVDFKQLYDEYCSSTWADIASDGSYLFIDTNPYDEDDDGLAYPAAYTAIQKINSDLGIPDSLAKNIEHTSSLDGKQSETFDELGITITWKYHPDKGLEIIYKKIE